MDWIIVTLEILVFALCIGIPLIMLCASLLCHSCEQDSDEEDNQSYALENIEISGSFARQWSRPTIPIIRIQENTNQVHIRPKIIANAGLKQPAIELLPTGAVGNKLLEENPELNCSICLGKYSPHDILRRLPCTHAFHVLCIDHWLSIKAICPLCNNNLNNLYLSNDTSSN